MKNLCVVDSVYALLNYMILNPSKIDETVYVCSTGIQDSIRKKLKYCYFIERKTGRFRFLRSLVSLLIKFLLDKKFRKLVFSQSRYVLWGQDHLFFSKLFFGKMSLLEDGVANYVRPKQFTLMWFFTMGRYLGESNRVEKIYLNSLLDIPASIKDKTLDIEIDKLWHSLSEDHKRDINFIFNYKHSKLIDSKNVLFLSQPLSEYNLISEEEKLRITRNALSEYDIKKVVIKMHPRENTNYEKSFPGITTIKDKYPSELLCFNGVNFDYVVTIYSSSVYVFKSSNRQVIGTEVSTKLSNKVGHIRSELI